MRPGPHNTWMREILIRCILHSQGVHYAPAANAEIASSLVNLVEEFFDDTL